MNMLVDFTSLAINAGSGPSGDIFRETTADKRSQDQPPGRMNTRVGEVVKSLENTAAELNWNHRSWRSGRKVTEDKGPTTGHRDTAERMITEKSSSLRAGLLPGG